jgi:hypothetical protein
VADALARCERGPERAAHQRREHAARLLFTRAREQAMGNQRHTARLYCLELLTHYPGTAGADDAKALLKTLDTLPPMPGKPTPTTAKPPG